MKLAELKFNTAELINIAEALRAEFDALAWSQRGQAFVGVGKIGVDEFHLSIEPMVYLLDKTELVWLNVAFSRLVDGEEREDLLGTGTDQSSQIGSVCNALRQKIEEMTKAYSNIVAIVFLIVAGEERRESFYKRLLSSNLYGLAPWRFRFKASWDKGTALVATQKILTAPESESIRQSIEAAGKSFGT